MKWRRETSAHASLRDTRPTHYIAQTDRRGPGAEALEAEIQSVRAALVLVEKDALKHALAKGHLTESAAKQLIAKLDEATHTPSH